MEDPFGCGNVCRTVMPSLPALGTTLVQQIHCALIDSLLQSVVSDENLWKEIDDRENIVTCSFWVCGDKLKIRRISVQK